MSEKELQTLRQRVAELERQLAEEREEFEWDLKAARESAAAASRKLEEEIAALKSAGGSGGGGADEVLTQRALMAERKVAELQQELKRARETPAKLSAPGGDTVMRQRAEAAEQERDQLRREKRSLDRQLEEKERALKRAEDKAGNTAELRRELEEARRDLLEKERSLSAVRRDLDERAEGDLELARLGRELAETREALAQKEEFLGASQSRVRELADQLSELEAVRDELDEIRQKFAGETEAAAEREQRLAELKATIEATGDAGQAKEKQLAEELESVQAELARTKMASSQMLEQRERELARLRSDMEQVQESARGAEGASERASRDVKRLELELSRAVAERDEAVQSLRQLREGETTQVGRPPETRDPFDEKTQRVAMEQAPGRDPFVEQTLREQAPRGAEAPQECIPPEMASGSASLDAAAFPAAGGPVTDPGSAGSPAQGGAFGKGETASGEPPMPAVEDLEPVDELESVDEADLPADELAQSSGERAMPGDQAAGVGAGDDLEPAEREEEGAEAGDDLDVEWVEDGQADGPPGEDAVELEPVDDLLESPAAASDGGPGASDGSASAPAIADQVTDPMGARLPEEAGAMAGDEAAPDALEIDERTAEVRSRRASAAPESGPKKSQARGKGLWIALGFVVLAGAVIGGAWFFFPRWFGLGPESGPADAGKTVPALAPDEEAPGPVDGGLAAVETVDGGPAAIAAGDESDDEVAQADAGTDTDAVDGGADQPEPPPARSPKEQRALERAQAFGLKLIMRRKHRQALKHLIQWVKKEPQDARLRYLYGRALVGRKKMRAAEVQMNKALELDPTLADAHYAMAGIAIRLKKTARAKEALETFLELAPDDKRAPAVRRNLKKMK